MLASELPETNKLRLSFFSLLKNPIQIIIEKQDEEIFEYLLLITTHMRQMLVWIFHLQYFKFFRNISFLAVAEKFRRAAIITIICHSNL